MQFLRISQPRLTKPKILEMIHCTVRCVELYGGHTRRKRLAPPPSVDADIEVQVTELGEKSGIRFVTELDSNELRQKATAFVGEASRILAMLTIPDEPGTAASDAAHNSADGRCHDAGTAVVRRVRQVDRHRADMHRMHAQSAASANGGTRHCGTPKGQEGAPKPKPYRCPPGAVNIWSKAAS